MPESGLLITFEGPEGSGKTTQIRRLQGWLEGRGHTVHVTREPGGTPIGDAIRAVLLDPHYREMSPEAEALLFSAARAQHVDQVIRPGLAEGITVLCDRYADSTMAYQGYGRGLDLASLRAITAFAIRGAVPDLTVYLDVLAAAGLERKQQGDQAEWNRMEREALSFHERVRLGFLQMAAQEPHRWLVVDASQPPDQVQEAIRSGVMQRLEVGDEAGDGRRQQ
jgi:dTMP kinase